MIKTKMTRAESKDRRRTHSLKGKDAFGLGKDVDLKLNQLEARIQLLLPTNDTAASPTVIFTPYLFLAGTVAAPVKCTFNICKISRISLPYIKIVIFLTSYIYICVCV